MRKDPGSIQSGEGMGNLISFRELWGRCHLEMLPEALLSLQIEGEG